MASVLKLDLRLSYDIVPTTSQCPTDGQSSCIITYLPFLDKWFPNDLAQDQLVKKSISSVFIKRARVLYLGWSRKFGYRRMLWAC